MESLVTATNTEGVHSAGVCRLPRAAFVVASPLGDIWLCAEADGQHGKCLTGLYFEAQNHFPDNLVRQPASVEKPAIIQQTEAQLYAYFKGELQQFNVATGWYGGSAFQRQVWQALLQIPFGATWSYARLARHMGLTAAHSRAVGSAVGRNPLTIIVPCHRVIGAAGAMTGYAGGIDRKRHLLRIELPDPPLFAGPSRQPELFSAC